MTNPNPSRRKNIKPGLQVPAGLPPELEKFLQNVKEHLQGADGARGQPKERFVTIEDLERIGLIRSIVKNGRGEVRALDSLTDLIGAAADLTSSADDFFRDLADVNVSGVQDGYGIRYHAVQGKWIAVPLFGPTNVILASVLPYFDEDDDGIVPASGGGTDTFLRADGTWAEVTAGGSLRYVNTTIPAGNTVANTASETTFASGYVIPARGLREGSVIRVHLAGVFGTDPTTPSDLRLRLKIGGVTVLDSGNLELGTDIANLGWWANAEIVVHQANVFPTTVVRRNASTTFGGGVTDGSDSGEEWDAVDVGGVSVYPQAYAGGKWYGRQTDSTTSNPVVESEDGITWTVGFTPGVSTDVIGLNGLLVGPGGLYYAFRGLQLGVSDTTDPYGSWTWTTVDNFPTNGVSGGASYTGLFYFAPDLYAVKPSTVGPIIVTSVDGISWAETGVVDISDNEFEILNIIEDPNNSRFLVFGHWVDPNGMNPTEWRPRVYETTDFFNMTLIEEFAAAPTTDSHFMTGSAYDGDMTFIAIMRDFNTGTEEEAIVYRSTDSGDTWAAVDIDWPEHATNPIGPLSIAWDGRNFLIGGRDVIGLSPTGAAASWEYNTTVFASSDTLSPLFTNGASDVGLLEAQGRWQTHGSFVDPIENTAQFDVDTEADNDVQVTVDWENADAQNTITLRQMSVRIDEVNPQDYSLPTISSLSPDSGELEV